MTAHMNQRKYGRTALFCSDFSVLFPKCCFLHHGYCCILSIFIITEFIFRLTKDSFVFYLLSPVKTVDSFKNQLFNCRFFS